MAISFRATFRDHLAFNFYPLVHTYVLSVLFIIVLAIGIEPNWDSVADLAAHHSLLYQIIFFVVLELVPIFIMIFLGGLTLFLGSLITMNKTLLTQRTLTFKDETILNESKYARIELKWSDVKKVARTSGYIFLYAGQRKTVAVPRRAFQTEEAWNQFWTESQARVKAARAKGQ